jgi:hypothetical protein
MEIGYSGMSRIIEPYSLAYKKPQDGEPKEYFYAWDRSGGTSETRGIKTFLHHKIESLKILNEQFEPRFEIEVSKAGESTRKSYFGKPFSEKKRSVASRRVIGTERARSYSFSTSFGAVYIYECSMCGKRFRRKSNNSKLNKHKDKFGNTCYGRYAMLLDTIF